MGNYIYTSDQVVDTGMVLKVALELDKIIKAHPEFDLRDSSDIRNIVDLLDANKVFPQEDNNEVALNLASHLLNDK